MADDCICGLVPRAVATIYLHPSMLTRLFSISTPNAKTGSFADVRTNKLI